MKHPVIELSDCVVCEICTDYAPTVFVMGESGYPEVIELEMYPEADVDEVIKNCPADCIFWSD